MLVDSDDGISIGDDSVGVGVKVMVMIMVTMVVVVDLDDGGPGCYAFQLHVLLFAWKRKWK